MPLRSVPLASGAEGRWTGEPGRQVVVCVNGGTAAAVPGTWSASLEWLVGRVAPQLPGLAFLEVRYRVKSWRRLDSCVQDGVAAIEAARAAGAERLALVGFSMGGAVAARIAGAPGVASVIGINPWLPRELDLSPLAGRRLAVVHGALDSPLPGIPGVKPAQSAAASERARALGADVVRRVVLGLHAVALRPNGRPVPLPGARAYAGFVQEELERFQA